MNWHREFDQEEIKQVQELPKEEKMLRNWRPSHETIEAISGKARPAPSDVTETHVHQRPFRDAMSAITPHERGEWGERAVITEAQGYGHRILSEHADTPTAKGYDCVSWDGQTIHVWESKNYSAHESDHARDVSDLNAVSRERRWENLKQVLQDIHGDAEEKQIREAIRQHRWELHIRCGPDTNIPRSLVSKLQEPWEGKVDERQYTYAEMVRIHRRN